MKVFGKLFIVLLFFTSSVSGAVSVSSQFSGLGGIESSNGNLKVLHSVIGHGSVISSGNIAVYGTLIAIPTNKAPIISGTPSTSVAEDSAYSFTPTGTDPDGDSLSYSIQHQPSWTNFDTTTGTLSGIPTNSDVGIDSNITISVSDGLLTTSLTDFNITVTNVNNAPTDIALSSNLIAENAGVNAVVGTLSSTDADSADSATYTLVLGTGDTDNGSFSISGTNLVFNVNANYEIKALYSIRVRVTDGSNATYEKSFNIEITNVNEAPSVTDTITNINENETSVTTINLSDEDQGDIYSFVIGGNDSDKLAIDSSGSVSFISAPNFESPQDYNSDNTYDITITVTDSGGLSDSMNLTVSVTDVYENDGISDVDGDGIADSIEGTGDDDGDGIPNYEDDNDKGNGDFITDANGDLTLINKKVAGSGDDKITSFTIPNGKPYTLTEQGDNSFVALNTPKVDVNITGNGSLDILFDETNGTHNITVANPGADIVVNNDNNMTIITPTIINADGSTCGYKLEIAYDGADMITKNIINAGLSNELTTTIIMKIPNADVAITADNKIVHTGNVTNSTSQDVNVTAQISCDGSVSTTTSIDSNNTYVALSDPGSTVIVSVNGDIETTNSYNSTNSNDEETLIELNIKIDSDNGDLNATKTTTNLVTNVVLPELFNKVSGSSLNINGNKVQEITTTLPDDRTVKIDIKDQQNNIVTTQTNIDGSLGVVNKSIGTNGSITKEVNLTSSTILINNYLNGEVEYTVDINGTKTQTVSNLEGTTTSIIPGGISTTLTNNSVDAKLETLNSGKIDNTIQVNNKTTRLTSDLIGAKSILDKDSNGDMKISTKVSTTNSNNKAVDITIDNTSLGYVVQEINLNGIITKATTNIAGATTNIKSDGELETNAVLPSNRNVILTTKPNGYAQHKISDGSASAIALFEVEGAKTVVSQTGEVSTEVKNKGNNCTDRYFKAKVLFSTQGKSQIQFNRYDCSDNEIESYSLSPDFVLPSENNITISDSSSSSKALKATIIIPVDADIQF